MLPSELHLLPEGHWQKCLASGSEQFRWFFRKAATLGHKGVPVPYGGGMGERGRCGALV